MKISDLRAQDEFLIRGKRPVDPHPKATDDSLMAVVIGSKEVWLTGGTEIERSLPRELRVGDVVNCQTIKRNGLKIVYIDGFDAFLVDPCWKVHYSVPLDRLVIDNLSKV